MVKVLDCTIRDGGYLNGWNFDKNIVDETYSVACKSGVDFFEIGYRMNKKFKGIYSKCPESIMPKGTSKLVVMVNASDFDINDFENRNDFIIRIACHYNEIRNGMTYCEMLYDKGYHVFLHLMNIDMVEDFDLLKKWKNKNILKSLYFADSYGSLTPEKVGKFYKKLQNSGFENISFHGHNNIQLAYANTLKAIELGAYSVDATVFGMGRGGGNLPIELLLGDKNQYYCELIQKYYLDLHKKYNWGYSLENLYTGLNNIHPGM